ncbi:MAG TPA: peptidase S41 [Marinilabiliales bacterium]|jgi:C-terminal processing protease CtpA/Prc|nr:MAG: hypothetical protein A2W95_06865 [Bacteroidetes bacterium GWA2_40_14]OFX61548.1 MAG: hypothetical protein A2W84_09985 [Bacteroidetes bacterium GWC2_40_13]OFX73576.1 MAG: hypothetical protein A2W96_02820 [Bacteroidetes bacterium GWD2_40_43]OFX90749.1 MAG: hypothetical protein A2W97_03220 [Bacteroidetes bacterium GWE2_40_63]OFY20619.1 MAG: hypothetical protein A2W88_13615 [Bacteroidetes bacterium GWF2_40_13]OFZ24666.1 MAG: hypothetical protein A2437_03685 [Bacteroidetes bacterium RIFOXYC
MKTSLLTKCLIFIGAFLFLFSSCGKDDTNSDNIMVNEWIFDVMTEVYFWYDEIPTSIRRGTETAPEEYFNSMLYTEEDEWSFITDDYTGLMAEFEGTPKTLGFAPAFGQFTGTNDVFAVVQYVYDNSPAEKAGLKRGDIILKINGTQLNTTNYADLTFSDSYTATLGEYSGSGIYETGNTVTMAAVVMEVNPFLLDTVITVNDQKIGYMVITEFTNEENFTKYGEPVFRSLKSQGIKNLVVDLRYNRGGEMNASIWLASALAPYTDTWNQQVLVKLTYNDLLQDDADQNNQSIYRFQTIAEDNLDLNTVYFLTTHYSTASASELVIVGLEPYMDVIQVGENTYGKYTGMWAIPDTEEPARHNWGILPIVMKYANANGKTDFKEGLVPDYYLEENPFVDVPFGDLDDPLFAKAVSLISGFYVESDFKNQQVPMDLVLKSSPKQQLKSNLLVPRK